MELKLDASPDDLKVFLEEAYEQLQLMDADLIALEKAGPEPQLLQEIFRVAHTLKGSSASIGHTRMAELTHAMESALDGVRQGRMGVTTELIDLLLESLDALRTLTDEAATLKVSDVDISLVVPRLLQMAEQDGDAAERNPALGNPVDRQGPLLYELQALGNNIFKVSIEIEGSAPLSAARCLQVLLELSALAEIVKSKPTQAELETGLDCHHLEVVCATKVDLDAIQNTLGSIVDVLRVWVVPYETDGTEGGDGNKSDERTLNLGPEAVGSDKDRRVIDLGLEARGKSPEEMLRMAASKTAQQVKTVRIDIERLDNLMNLVGELVIDNTRLAQIASRLRAGLGDEDLIDRLGEATSHLGRLTDELQQEIMKSRMLPIENVFSKFPRMVRNLAHKAGKEIELIINGQETELDRSVIEEIGDPLIHLLRNAVDHGIEGPDERVAHGKPRQGTVRLSAFHQENHIVLTVEDDGRGIDPERIRASAVAKGVVSPEVVEKLTDQEVIGLIFAPGFSTTDKLSDISGRGVGMDIVRTNIERLNGTVNVETTVGVGSKFVVRLPLTLAIIRALLVSVCEGVYAIPLVFVTETMRIDVDRIHRIGAREAVEFRDQVLPLLRLRDLFLIGANDHLDEKRVFVVVIKHAGRQVGLVVDRLIGEQEVVIKSLGRFLGDVKGISGAAILGDGRVGLIVDVSALVQVAIDEQTGRVTGQ